MVRPKDQRTVVAALLTPRHIAKFWASEGGQRIVATAQQVHGGVGIDTTYPLFRYYLFAKQNELSLGAAPQQLAGLTNGYMEGER